MNEHSDLSVQGFGNHVFPCQYNDLIRRPSDLDGERRLLWAVLEDAVRLYLANVKRSTRNQRVAFEEVRRWFTAPIADRGLFAFRTICDVLEIDAGALLRGLKSMRLRTLPSRRQHCIPRSGKMRSLAA